MKTYLLNGLKIAFVCFFCLTIFVGQAQILNPTNVLKRKLEQKVNEKLEKKVNDKVEQKMEEKIGKVVDFDVKPKVNYAFSSSILQKMTIINKSKTETSYMKMLFSKESTAMGVLLLDKDQSSGSEKGTMVMDLEQKAFFTFNVDKKGNKNYFGMRLKEQPTQETETTTTTKPEKKFTKTNKTKTIMGYSCEGYQMDGDNGDTFIMWVTTSSVAGMNDYAKAMQQYGSQQRQRQSSVFTTNIETWAKEGKAVLGHDHISKNGDQVLTELEKISLDDPSTFNTEGYKSAFAK